MQSNSHVQTHDHAISVALVCGLPQLTMSITRSLEQRGLQVRPAAEVTIILDARTGFALRALQERAVQCQRVIVVTSNPCVEYWEDIWDLNPHILLTQPTSDLVTAVTLCVQGERYRDTPVATSLTPAERRILCAIAYGWNNQQVAVHLQLAPRTVMNTISHIYEKLGLASRTEAALYYWGVKHTLTQMHYHFNMNEK